MLTTVSAVQWIQLVHGGCIQHIYQFLCWGCVLLDLLVTLRRPRSLLRSLPRLVCCTAEVRQMRRQGDDERSVAVLALGRQRAEVMSDGRNCAQSQVRCAGTRLLGVMKIGLVWQPRGTLCKHWG